jgi:hypothetical protein
MLIYVRVSGKHMDFILRLHCCNLGIGVVYSHKTSYRIGTAKVEN